MSNRVLRYVGIVWLAIPLLWLPAGRSARADDRLEGLDDYIAAAMSDWEAPGLAIAIVKDDQIVLAKGYGVRRLGESAPVDERTLFAIGSSSKAFTAACLAMLVDEGRLSWNDAATAHLPGFELYDPYVTRELTVRDLLCHRSGLARGDGLWYATSFDRDEILRRIRHLKPSWSFRSRFGYQNIMYLAAGQIVPRASGLTWDDFVSQRLFQPLGMATACTSITELASHDNIAAPHVKLDGSLRAVAWRNIDNVAPAGSINACAAEMAQWVRLHLGEGMHEGKQLISAESIRAMQTSQTIVPPEDSITRYFPKAHFVTYGLGWFLHDYRGRKVVEHGGAIDGMRAQVALLPEEKLGLVVLCNRGGSGLPPALMYHVFDRYLGCDEHDWSREMLAAANRLEQEAKEAKARQEAQRAQDTKPSLPLQQYAGAYADDLYGAVKVTLHEDRLVLERSPAIAADLEHWHYDTFRAVFRDPVIEPLLTTFRLDADGKVKSVLMTGLGEFTREE